MVATNTHRQQNEQAYSEYQKRLAEQAEQERRQQQLVNNHRESIEALDSLRYNRFGVWEDGNGLQQHEQKGYDPLEKTKGQQRLEKAQSKMAAPTTYGGLLGMPFLAKDAFAGTSMAGFKGPEMAAMGNEIRDYRFGQRLSRYQNTLGMSKRDALIASGKLKGVDTSKMSDLELQNLAKSRFIGSRFTPLDANEAGRFAVTKAQISADRKHVSHPETQTSIDKDQISNNAISEFNSKDKITSKLGNVLYGTNDHRQNILRGLPGNFSNDTVHGQVLGKVGGAAATAIPLLPMINSGLASAKQFDTLSNLRKNRDVSGASGKVAEAGITTSNTMKSFLTGPASLALGGSLLPGAMGEFSKSAFRGIKDFGFNLTGGIGKTVLGEGATKGLANATMNGGFLGSMASIAPNIVGGLTMALPGIIGSVAKGISEKRQRMLRGVRPSTNRLVKKYSRTVGIMDSVIRNLASTGQIQTDRAMELTLLTYIEQGIAGLVGQADTATTEKQKDTNESLKGVISHSTSHYKQTGYAGFRDAVKEKTSRFGRRTLNDLQEISHAMNIPGQIMDLLFHGKTPGARKREFAEERASIFDEKHRNKFIRDTAKNVNRSGSYIQLLNTPLSQLISKSGAITPEGQTVSILGSIYTLLQGHFSGIEDDRFSAIKGKRSSIKFQTLDDDRTAFTKIMHSIPILSTFYDLIRMPVNKGKELVGAGISAYKGIKSFAGKTKNAITSFSDNVKNTIPELKNVQKGDEFDSKTTLGKIFSIFGLGKTADKYTKSAYDLADKRGYTITDEKRNSAFNKVLPNLWDKLLYFQELSYETLLNIFETTSTLNKSITGIDVAFATNNRQQNVFDAVKGNYVSIDDYNKDRKKVLDDIKSEAVSTDSPGWFKKKLFGSNYVDKRKSHIESKIQDQANDSDVFRTENRDYINRTVSDTSAVPKSNLSQQCCDDDCCNKTNSILHDIYSSINKIVFNTSLQTKSALGLDSNTIFQIPNSDCCDKSTSILQNIYKFITQGFGGTSQFQQLETSTQQVPQVPQVIRNVDMEINEIEEEQERQEEKSFRKVIVDRLKQLFEFSKKTADNTSSKPTGDSKGGMFGKLGMILSTALAPLIAAITPLIAPIVATGTAMAAMALWFKGKASGTSFKAAGLDVIQDLGMLNKGVTNLPTAAKTAGSVVNSAISKAGNIAQGSKLGSNISHGINGITEGTKGTGIISSAFNKVGSIANAGISKIGEMVPKGLAAIKSAPLVGSAAKGIGAVSRVAGKFAPWLTAADATVQLGGDIKNSKRFDERYDKYTKEMSNSGILGKTWATAKRIINPYEGGSIIGTGIRKLQDKTIQKLTGDKDATLGGKLYDWLHPSFNKPTSTPNTIKKPTSELENKTDEQTEVLKQGFDKLIESNDSLFDILSGKVKAAFRKASDFSSNISTRGADAITHGVEKATDFVAGGVTKLKNKFTEIGSNVKYAETINKLAAKYGVDPSLAAAVVKTESGFNPNAVSGVGAQGLMQLMPGTAKDLGVKDSFNPEQNLEGGIKYLAQLNKKFNGDTDKVLAGYNWGPNRKELKGDTLDTSKLPKETKDYLAKVKRNMPTKEEMTDAIAAGKKDLRDTIVNSANQTSNVPKTVATNDQLDKTVKQAKIANNKSIDKYPVPFSGALTNDTMKAINNVNSNTIALQKSGETHTEKENVRKSMVVTENKPVGTPVGTNLGMSMSKSQSTKERPKNEDVTNFIDGLFKNTVIAFQQSVKSFGLGQTPFQILS